MNSTDAPIDIHHFLEEANKKEYNDTLKPYQRLPTQYLMKYKELTGLLVYVEMGFGKTRIAIDMAEHLHQQHPDYKIIVLTIKTLHENFKRELEEYLKMKYGNDVDMQQHLNKYKYVTLNSYNMFENMVSDEIDFEGVSIEAGATLEKTIIIFDEFHLFIHSVSNGSKNAVQLYYALMKTKNKKLIALTGTPIINNVFALALGYNLLRGYMSNKALQGVTKGPTIRNDLTLFPESEEAFYKYFVSENGMINKDKYANRITGLTYYYGSKLANVKLEIAKLEPIIYIECKMSPEQVSRYVFYRTAEKNEKSFSKTPTSLMGGKKSTHSTFRIKSRKVGNFLEELTEGSPLYKELKELIAKGNKDDIDAFVDKVSPKHKKLRKIINKHDKQLGLIYSSLVHKCGVNDIATLLREVDGYGYIDTLKDESYDYKRYAIITGDIDPEDRFKAISIYNRKENADGKLIRFILISGAAALGVSLLRGRWCVLFDPPWDESTTMQIIYRILRMYAHIDLDEADRNVQAYMLFAVREGDDELSTDQYLFEKAQKTQRLIDENLELAIYSSINCLLHHDINVDNITYEDTLKCNVCKKTDSMLYYPNVEEDMRFPSLCEPLVDKKITVEKVVINGDEYYYDTSDKDKIYILDENNEYIELTQPSLLNKVKAHITSIKGGSTTKKELILTLSDDQQQYLNERGYTLVSDKWGIDDNTTIYIGPKQYKKKNINIDTLRDDHLFTALLMKGRDIVAITTI
jgi:hypothetical protein